MQASDVRDLDAASWAVVLSPTRDMTPAGMKLCMECGALKELTEFRKDGVRHDGYFAHVVFASGRSMLARFEETRVSGAILR